LTGVNDLLALGQGFGQTPAEVPIVRRAEPPLTAEAAPRCDPGSRPEPGVDGRVPASAIYSGAAAAGCWCNLTEIAHQGHSGGFKVFRYVDTQGHVCAFYDTALVYPLNALRLTRLLAGGGGAGHVRPRAPDPDGDAHFAADALAARIAQPEPALRVAGGGARQSRDLSRARVDLRRARRLPAPGAGLDRGGGAVRARERICADGGAFYAAGTAVNELTAIDVTDPKHPHPIWVGNLFVHGLNISDDGNRACIADPIGHDLLILDTSQIQARVPHPRPARSAG
jgi:hypothetical protein